MRIPYRERPAAHRARLFCSCWEGGRRNIPKMASEQCARTVCKGATGSACYSGRVSEGTWWGIYPRGYGEKKW